MKLGERMGKDYALPAERVCLAGQECTGHNGEGLCKRFLIILFEHKILVHVLNLFESEHHK